MIPLLAALALAPTRFQVVQDNGISWLTDPVGHKTVSFGVCCVEPGTPFVTYDPGNPSYAAWKYYPNLAAWSQDTVDRLQSWSFNTIGAWSNLDQIRNLKTQGLYFTPILHMGSGAGAPWRDMWDPEVVKVMDQIAHDQILPLKGDNRVIGYFSDNEQGWWEGALQDWAWKTAGGRSHMLAVLKQKYPTWQAMTADFEPDGASSFAQLAKTGRVYLRPGGNGMPAVQAYMKVLAGRYYSLCRDIIKKYDPGALYLGDRYISNFYPEVAEASAPYVDICSSNVNADWIPNSPPAKSDDWNDGGFARFYFPTLENCVKKPIMVTEYYMTAKENRTGNKNDSSGFPVVETQAQRAAGFASQTRYFLGHPYVVGAHWFQLSDEAKNGRGDGENYDMGLVDVDNRPYEEITQAAKDLNLTDFHTQARTTQDKSSAVIPRIQGDPNNLQNWDRQDGYVASDNDFPRGDLYLGWQPGHLYVGLYWNEDRFAEAFYKSGKVPDNDQPGFSVQLNGHTYRGRVDSDFKPDGYTMKLYSGDAVRKWAILDFPTQTEPIQLTVDLQTRGRAYSGRWSGSFKIRP
jgi:hypothetical protein